MTDRPAAEPPAPATPRPAATVLILRDGAKGIEVFMVVRHHEVDFATSAMVFPGGKVDKADGAPVWETLAPAGGPGPSRAFAVAAVRETFEEAGLLLARHKGGKLLLEPAAAHAIVERHRKAADKGEGAFARLIEAEELTLATDLLVHFAHWITPVVAPKRFDTHFYLVAAPVEQLGAHDGSESVEGFWIGPARALADGAAGKRQLVPATRLNLQKLTRFATVAEAVAAARLAPVVTVCPEVKRNADGSRSITIPIEAGYGIAEYEVAAGVRTASGT